MKKFLSIDRSKGVTAILNYSEDGINRAVRFDKAWTDAQAKKHFGVDDATAGTDKDGKK